MSTTGQPAAEHKHEPILVPPWSGAANSKSAEDAVQRMLRERVGAIGGGLHRHNRPGLDGAMMAPTARLLPPLYHEGGELSEAPIHQQQNTPHTPYRQCSR